MKDPLIIKSTFYNLSPEDLEKTRRNIKRQMQEENPVVVLPCDFEIANVDTELLEKLKTEIDDLDRHFDNDYFSGNKESMFKCNEVFEILDNYIKELKGENKCHI